MCECWFCHRVLETVIVLLCDGDKGSQAKDIRTAKRLINELE
jgi:putative component of toxin-antitoxin plasmid stabilization module